MRVLLSVQRALLMEVGENLRAVSVDWDQGPNRLDIRLFFTTFSPASDADIDSAGSVGTEVHADFDPDVLVTEHFDCVPFPDRLPSTGKVRVFERRPPEFDE